MLFRSGNPVPVTPGTGSNLANVPGNKLDSGELAQVGLMKSAPRNTQVSVEGAPEPKFTSFNLGLKPVALTARLDQQDLPTQLASKTPAETHMTGTEPAIAAVKSSTTVTASHWVADAQAAGAEKPHAAKFRVGAARNQLPTATSANKSGPGVSLPNATANTVAPETAAFPRATVDLIARATPSTLSGDTESDAHSEETLLAKPDGARSAVPPTTPDTENAFANEQAHSSLAPTDPAATNTSPPEQMGNLMDELSGQIAYWASQGNQRASLTVGNDTDTPLEVSIAMRDGEVHVAFEAAQGEIRDALSASAEALLKNMLESRGMTLGDVTVSQRQSPPQQDAPTPDNRNQGEQTAPRGIAGSSARASAAVSAEAVAQIPRRPNIATAQKVDLFA